MRMPIILFVAMAALTSAACSESTETPTQPESITVPVQVTSAQNAEPHNLRTHLTGDEEVPPRDTDAQGQATFQINDAGDEISFKLNVANIENVTQAHIHLGPVGDTGDIVVWLYPDGPPAQLIPGRTQGTLGEGVITESSLVGPLEGQPLDALIDALRNGDTYVNVHTQQFPPGEIRGQID